MEDKKFNRYKKALEYDLSKVEKYNPISFGKFLGSLEMNAIWLNMNKPQEEELEKMITETFSSKNFSLWSGKRKTTSQTKAKGNNE